MRARRFRTQGMDSSASRDVDMLDPGSRPVDSAIGGNEPTAKRNKSAEVGLRGKCCDATQDEAGAEGREPESNATKMVGLRHVWE